MLYFEKGTVFIDSGFGETVYQCQNPDNIILNHDDYKCGKQRFNTKLNRY